MPFAASPTFGLLYRSTLEYKPEAFILMLVGIYVLLFFITLSVHIFMVKLEKATIPTHPDGSSSLRPTGTATFTSPLEEEEQRGLIKAKMEIKSPMAKGSSSSSEQEDAKKISNYTENR